MAESCSRRQPGLVAWLFFAPLLLWLVLFVVIPTLLLIVISFAERDDLGRVVFHFTWQNYLRAFDWVWFRIFLNSVWYACLTTVLCAILGYPVGYFIGRSPERWRNLLLILVMIPFWTSFLIRTYAWITILSRDGILNGWLMAAQITTEPITFLYTPFSVVLGLVYTYLPFMILPIYTSAEKLDGALIEAAYDLGANTMLAFVKVILPLTRPGLVAGALLVFVPSIAMFAVTTLLGGGTNPTIGEVIHQQFTRARNQPFGAALGTLLLALFLLSLWLSKFARPAEER